MLFPLLVTSIQWRVADNANLVSLSVPEINPEIVIVVFMPDTRWSFARCAVCQCYFIALPNHLAIRGQECNHLTVSNLMVLFVKRFCNHKQRARSWFRLPPCPRSPGIAESLFNFEHGHQGSIEREGALKISYTDEYVGEHRSGSRSVQTHAKHTCNFESRRKARFAVLTERLVKTLPAKSGIFGDLGSISQER